MRNFIENNNNKNQSGHQGQHSTLTSLFKFRDDIKKAMNKNKINGYCVQTNWKKSLWPPFYVWVSSVARLQSHYEETDYFLTLITQEFLVLIWSTSEGWKTVYLGAMPLF